MKILIWNNIWITQGNFLFSFNCFKNYLIKEANVLAASGHSVDIAIPEHFKNNIPNIHKSVKIISFNLEEAYVIGKSFDPIFELYKCYDTYKLETKILSEKLERHYDAILLWETPVPFLEKLYPEALIIHQMPGVFSRPPAQNFITIDTKGLFNRSLIKNFHKDVKQYTGDSLFENYIKSRKDFFYTFDFYEKKISNLIDKSLEIILLPLQVSAHYNFKADTKYQTQLEFLLDVINKNKNSNIITTQYVTQNISDTVLTSDNVNYIKSLHPHFIFDKSFNDIPSVSELILQKVDKVISCSSSLALQGILHSKQVQIYGETYLKPYDNTENEYSVNSVGSFLLEKYNLNFDFAIQDKTFLNNFIEELWHKKDLKGIDSLVSFSEISDEYVGSLEINREGRAKKNWIDWIKKQNLCVNGILKELKNPEIKIVSFDIFDTLITRPLFRPTDLFKLLANYVSIKTNGRILNFDTIRTESEKCLKQFKEEVSIDEIYNNIRERLDLDWILTEEIKQKEIELEIALCKASPEGRKIYLEAKRLNKKIIFTTDMYLPKSVVSLILTKNGYVDYSNIYISSEIRKTKAANGNLFEYVVKNENCPAEKILHIGDKKITDVENAKKKGIKAFRLISSIDRIKGNKAIIESFAPLESINRGVFLGLYKENILNQECKFLCENSIFQNSLFNFGYAAIGPFVLGFALWINEIAKKNKYDCLFFLAREGLLIKKALNIINASINTRYLLASRKSLYGASIKNIQDIYTYCNLSFADKSKLSDIIKSRFDIDEKEILEYCNDSVIQNDSDGRNKLFEVALHFKEKILENSKSQFNTYNMYLTESNFYSYANVAIVDIGWQGRMQSRLELITGKKIDGLYYAILPNAINILNTYSYTGNKIEKDSNSIAASYRKYIEYFICAPTKSFVRFELNGGKLIPIYADEDSYYERSKIIEEIHSGAIQFVRDYFYTFNNIQRPTYKECESIFRYVLQNKLLNKIQALRNLTFNDEIAGSKNLKLINHIDSKFINLSEKGKDENIIRENKQPQLAKNNKEEKITLKRKIEKWLIDHWATDQKKKKYYKDRESYIKDSKSLIIKLLS